LHPAPAAPGTSSHSLLLHAVSNEMLQARNPMLEIIEYFIRFLLLVIHYCVKNESVMVVEIDYRRNACGGC